MKCKSNYPSFKAIAFFENFYGDPAVYVDDNADEYK